MNITRIGVVGDSFIKDAAWANRHRWISWPREVKVEFVYKLTRRDGLHHGEWKFGDIRALERGFRHLYQRRWDMVVLAIGGNDLMNGGRPSHAADRLYNIALQLLESGIRRVVFMAAITRRGAAFSHPNSKFREGIETGERTLAEAEEVFDGRVEEFNACLRELIKDNLRMCYRHHRGIFHLQDVIGALKPDGVHLTDQALKKYTRSLKQRILQEAPVARAFCRDPREAAQSAE